MKNYVFRKPKNPVYILDANNNPDIYADKEFFTTTSINKEVNDFYKQKEQFVNVYESKDDWNEKIRVSFLDNSAINEEFIISMNRGECGKYSMSLINSKKLKMQIHPEVLKKNKNQEYSDLNYLFWNFCFKALGLVDKPPTNDKEILKSFESIELLDS